MNAILDRIASLAEGEGPLALCTVVSTDGSTPQEAGAKMLVVPPAFETIGTLGGGCVEAEVRRRVADVLLDGTPKLLGFRLDSDYGWDDGLICGGQMTFFLDVVCGAAAEVFRRLGEEVRAGRPAALVTAVRAGPAARVRTGEKWLATAPGAPDLPADPGGGLAEALRRGLRDGRPRLVRVGEPAADGAEFFVDPLLPRPTLLIAGAGHIGKALAEIAAGLEFSVVVVDDRAEYACAARLPRAERIVVGDIARELRAFPIDGNTYVVIVTRGHHHDEEALEAVIGSGARYIGMIGSRRKVRLIFDDLKERGVDAALLARVFTPVGLDIGAGTVPEIAVSIAAQLVQVRRAAGAGEVSRLRMPGVEP